jgi:two-component system response regulator NreC
MTRKIRVLIVDDHAVLRAGLRMLVNAEPDMEVVCEAEKRKEAFDCITQLQPDVILLDISLPDDSGLDMVKHILDVSPSTRIIILTMHDQEGYLRKAMTSGASGYILKKAADTELLSAIRVVYQGGTFLHKAHSQILFVPGEEPVPDIVEEKSCLETLSPRELEVLRMIAKGFTNRQTAETLYLSEKSVETYKSRLMGKLGLQSRVELIQFAFDQGLLGEN